MLEGGPEGDLTEVCNEGTHCEHGVGGGAPSPFDATAFGTGGTRRV